MESGPRVSQYLYSFLLAGCGKNVKPIFEISESVSGVILVLIFSHNASLGLIYFTSRRYMIMELSAIISRLF